METAILKNDMDAFFDAISQTADLSFDPDNLATPIQGKETIARRPSGSSAIGFIRPGERAADGTPFEPERTRCPRYLGPPDGRAPNADEKRVTWPLQNEYLADRLGRDTLENSRNWETAKWIDKVVRIATMPHNAVRAPSMMIASTDYDTQEISGFAIQHESASEAFPILKIEAEIREQAKISQIDVDKLLSETNPRLAKVDVPSLEERASATKIFGMLRLGMRDLWQPTRLAIFENTEMFELGVTQGVRREIAPAVGRQRVIEGLRLAASIRRSIANRQNVDESLHWPALTIHAAFLDRFIREILNATTNGHVAANDNIAPTTAQSVAA